MQKIALGKRAKKHKGLVALVDDEDFEELAQHNWYASHSAKIDKYYAQRHIPIGNKDQRSVRMHRLITGAGHVDKVVHLNGNTLDNRKENLKVVWTSKEDWDGEIENDDDLDL